ncbi:MAG TPA: hypothetical protein VNJ03_06800 [Vicinamibacterales bacterium]|nr:hypothetical protein [Vicinamibacterales bacterium]
MSDPRNAAHAKKVTQEKKHQSPEGKPAGRKKRGPTASVPVETAAAESSGAGDSSAPKPQAGQEAALAVLAQLNEMEFYSRANLERLAALGLTVEDELKQKAIVGPLSDVYAAQNAFQTTLTALIDAYKAECDRMGESGQA